jgi:hypothetical protein
VKIKDRNKIINDIIKDGKKHPNGWSAAFGKDSKRLSRDYYLSHPKVGIYLLKEYNKNPFKINGIGAKIARRVDKDIEAKIHKYDGDFGIVQGNFQKILKNIEKGIKPETIFESALKGKKDMGIKMPVKGKASSSKKIFDEININSLPNKKKINEKFEKIAYDDGLYKGYD